MGWTNTNIDWPEKDYYALKSKKNTFKEKHFKISKKKILQLSLFIGLRPLKIKSFIKKKWPFFISININ